VIGIVVALALWELAPRLGWVREQSVPPFSRVVDEAVDVLGDPGFLSALGATAWRSSAGFALAVAIGVPLGLAMGRSRSLHALVDPLLVAAYPVPKAALILLFVLWWGAGDESRIAIVVIGCLIPLVIAAYHGASAVPPVLLWSARGLNARTWRVILPAALPQVLSGGRIAVALAIFTALASELLIRGSGVGSLLFTALDNGQTPIVFAISTIVATLGFLVDAAYVLAVRRALPWQEGEV
jgi:ABC-type nitrate/sulfonate/bicarbonate transport system permease component